MSDEENFFAVRSEIAEKLAEITDFKKIYTPANSAKVTELSQVTPNAQVYYSVKESYVEKEYHFMGKVKVMHYNKEQIYNNFWGCLYDLDNRLLED